MGYLVGITAVYFVVNLIVAEFMKNVAYAKGYDDNAHAFGVAFWLGLPGWLYVVALPDLVARDNQGKILAALGQKNSKSYDESDDQLPTL